MNWFVGIIAVIDLTFLCFVCGVFFSEYLKDKCSLCNYLSVLEDTERVVVIKRGGEIVYEGAVKLFDFKRHKYLDNQIYRITSNWDIDEDAVRIRIELK